GGPPPPAQQVDEGAVMVRVSHHYVSGRKLLFFFAESWGVAAAGLAGATGVTSGFAFRVSRPPPALVVLVGLALAFAVLLQFVLYLLDLYDLKVAGQDRGHGTRALRGAGVALALLAAALAVGPAGLVPPGALLGVGLGGALGSLAIRAAVRALVGAPRRILLIGSGARAQAVARAIANETDGYRVAEQWSGEGQNAAEVAERCGADLVISAPDDARGMVSSQALLECRVAGREVYDAAGFFERSLRRIPVQYLRPADFAYSDDLSRNALRRFAKRAFDLVMACVLSAVFTPFMAVVALAVKLDSMGPVLYGQDRVGQAGRTFRLWKFRSMRSDAEKDGAVWAREDDDRVTRVGRLIRKTRMDELPQLFNVLLGDMSFVGPRPERPVFVAELRGLIPFYGLREVVKPGITGWAQIRYPYGASVEDARNKLEYDLYYLKNGTLLLDLAIAFHTVRHVLLGRGAR
ncbi:MAG: exopolysaccharide biosynthesis polyprenyl glycosylphosphotransferase, partial [Myxococcaceae bacterium]